MNEQLSNTVMPGSLVGGLTKDVSPLQATLNRHGEQIDKLGGLVAQLSERLVSVRNMVPTDSKSGAQPELAASPAVGQLMRQTDMVQQLQVHIQELLSDIEV